MIIINNIIIIIIIIIIVIIGESVGVNGDSGSASVKASEPIKGT